MTPNAPLEKRPFSYQQSGNVSLVNGSLTVQPKNNWPSESQSARWQMDGFIPQASADMRIPLTLSMISDAYLLDIIVRPKTGSASGSLRVGLKLIVPGTLIPKGSQVDLILEAVAATEISFTVHLTT